MVENSKVARFKIVSRYKKKYLVDMDTYKLAWIFPVMSWYFKNDAMEITTKEYQILREKRKSSSLKSGLSLSGIALGGSLYKFIKAVDKKDVGFFMILILLMITYFIVFTVRNSISETNYEKLKDIVGEDELCFNGMIFVDRTLPSTYRKKCVFKTLGRLFLTGTIIFGLFKYNGYGVVIMLAIYQSMLLSKFSLLDPPPEIKVEYLKKQQKIKN